MDPGRGRGARGRGGGFPGRGRGQAEGGGRGRGRGGANGERPKTLCHHFQRGACWRGDACNFSHDLSTAAAPGAAQERGGAGGGAGGGIPLRCFLKAESRPLLDEKAVRNFVRALSACEDQVEVGAPSSRPLCSLNDS